ARAVGRQKEIGIRLALGASRTRLIRQLLVESVLMAAGGAVFGYLLAIWASASLSQMQLSLPFPIDFSFKPDGRVFLYTVGLTVITGLLFGLMPAIRASRPDIVGAIRDTAVSITGSRRFGLRNMLVVLQVALSLVLVIGSGLFL